jgi:hypothetical protein
MEIRVDQYIGNGLGVVSRHAQLLKTVSGKGSESIDFDDDVSRLRHLLIRSHYPAAL